MLIILSCKNACEISML